MLQGLILGLLTYASMVLTYLKLPHWVRRQLLSWKLLTDICAGILVYLVLGAISKSIVAIVGAITAGLLVGLSLEATPRLTNNESTENST